jgi:glyoxylase-like metal-dependent hydrolase (beta-lactamase superfamily II)
LRTFDRIPTGFLNEEMEIRTNEQVPESRHFRLEEMSDRVYAAIHVDGGAAIGNAGIVDLGDRTLVYDSFFSPQAAEDLRVAAEGLFDRPIHAVINSHWHNDHIWGNQVFDADTDIVGSEETRRLYIATRGHGAYDQFMADAEANLEATVADMEATQDEGRRRQLKMWVDYHQAVVDLKPILRIRPPNLTFDKRMLFHGPQRSAELLNFENGHTESDTILWLPAERIAFMSDLLFIGHQPYLGGGDPDSLCQILDQVSALEPRLLLPGHGPVGTAGSLAVMAQYVRALDDLAAQLVEAGEPQEALAGLSVPEPFENWLLASFFPVNMLFLYERRQSRRSVFLI